MKRLNANPFLKRIVYIAADTESLIPELKEVARAEVRC